MTRPELMALNRTALDPRRSVVVEAVAGSGKTWLLVARIVRLLLEGVRPSEILAITFTRKAAQEMAERLREWLYFLATQSEDKVCEFLRERSVPEPELDAAVVNARLLYERFLTAQPPMTLTTFHSWYLQLLKRAPLEAGALGSVNLVEHMGALADEAWQRFGSRVEREPGGPLAAALDHLFRDYGLENTRKLLRNFIARRADWWAYTHGERDAVSHALGQLAQGMAFDPSQDAIEAARGDAALQADLADFAVLLASNTPTDLGLARAWEAVGVPTDSRAWFDAACALVLTASGTARARKANAAQLRRMGAEREARLIELHERLTERLLALRAWRANRACYRANEAALTCGVALLGIYQALKSERQAIDYGDIEWHAYSLVSVSDHAAYMHCKLDSRYRHILLDEFQDTNPLQWLTLQSWFAAGAQADSRPVVFLVGDPKQSIYRFRGAEARLFDEAGACLQADFGATKLVQHESRRCASAVIEVVNRLFASEPDFKGYERHEAHFREMPGRVEVLPLVLGSGPNFPKMGPGSNMASIPGMSSGKIGPDPILRNPLQQALEVDEDLRRATEAQQLVGRINDIVGVWQLVDEENRAATRPARFRDIMLLVKKRTHLEVYERALKAGRIPFVTSRQGGLLATLEVCDMRALLEFLVSPYANLRLAHALRSPIFGLGDADLIALAQTPGDTWWERLGRLAADASASAGLRRAHALLSAWLARSGELPVHDQLDRIYFEGDVMLRYERAAPEPMRESVRANLHAFMQRALDTDAGRYPSLPRFLHELEDLGAAAADEAPDEGIVGDSGDAVRILTVHGAKGLEKPIVWLLDAGAGVPRAESYEVMVDWPPQSPVPVHFSMYTRKPEQGAGQSSLAETQAELARREELNLLYVAMTRAQQALLVSGCEGRGRKGSWYDKVRAAVRRASEAAAGEDDLAVSAAFGDDFTPGAPPIPVYASQAGACASPADPRLLLPLPTGTHRDAPATRGERYGTQFHRLMERLTSMPEAAAAGKAGLALELGIDEREFEPMWESAQRLLHDASLARFFDPAQYLRAADEVAFVSATGELRRIDRLVEFEDETWVLDYKTGERPDDAALLAQYEAQLALYREAVASLVPGKRVRSMLLFASGAQGIIVPIMGDEA